MVDRAKIEEVLSKIIDPEIGLPITQMRLIDNINISKEGYVFIDFHLTAPFCPPIFALQIAQEIKNSVSNLEGVKDIKVTLKGHYLADQINRMVNKK